MTCYIVPFGKWRLECVPKLISRPFGDFSLTFLSWEGNNCAKEGKSSAGSASARVERYS
jgi:hypothetical protein